MRSLDVQSIVENIGLGEKPLPDSEEYFLTPGCSREDNRASEKRLPRTLLRDFPCMETGMYQPQWKKTDRSIRYNPSASSVPER
jgi:hypothetical protein